LRLIAGGRDGKINRPADDNACAKAHELSVTQV
jgi:hypothetical protein